MPPADRSPLPLPAPLRLRPSFPFVGRPRELQLLRSHMPRALSEGRRIVLVGGEAGSGKSRLVREFAHDAAGEGAVVLYGACDAVVRTPYRPVVEALEELVRRTDPDDLRRDLGPGGGELARLLPDLPTRVGGLLEPVTADQDTERHRLHAAVADLLVATGRRRPVVLVCEDGHWADTPTLLLLRHLSRAAAEARMLIVATFRDAEADMPEELSDALVELRRSEGVVRVRLGGLSASEIEEFVRKAVGGEPGAELAGLAAALRDLTGGNAFLLTELWRTLVETGAVEIGPAGARLVRPLQDVATPETVREVVSQRLGRLDPETRAVLELAAVAGAEFEPAVLRRAGGLGEAELVAALDRAVRSGMIEEVPGRALAHRFAHELVRKALSDRLTGPRRAELHLRVAEAIEASVPEPSARVLTDLAHHFAAAAPVGGSERAVAYNLRAAEAATAGLAFAEAVAPLETALELGVADPRERARIRLDLGGACFRAGRSQDALEAYERAGDEARTLRDGELLARAATGYELACWRMGLPDERGLGFLEEALRALDPGDSTLRVQALVGLGRALAFTGAPERSAEVREEAIAIARRLGDRRALATVLTRSYWMRGTTPFPDILDLLTEGRDLAGELGEVEIEAEAVEWRIAVLLALGDLEAARAELAAALRMAARMRQPFVLHLAEQYASAIALCDGRLAEAEAAAERSHEWSRLLTGRDASAVYGIQMFGVRREQGRLAELAPVVRVLAGADRPGAWRPGLASLMAELGMEAEARRELERLRAEGLEGLRPSLWMASLTYLADACAAVGDRELGRLVYAELLPHSGTSIMIGHGVACYGAADRYLGMLAAADGDLDLAERHLAAALDVNRRMGARTWQAHTAFHLGRVLAAGGEDERAAEHLADAADLAERIGMRTLLARIRGREAPVAVGAGPDGLSAREVEILRLVARGRSNRDIGRHLSISEHTAANHIRSILRKTGCANRTEAAAYAHSHGLTGTGAAGR